MNAWRSGLRSSLSLRQPPTHVCSVSLSLFCFPLSLSLIHMQIQYTGFFFLSFLYFILFYFIFQSPVFFLLFQLQAFFLVADDIMDASVTRRGQPCWYKRVSLADNSWMDTFLLIPHILCFHWFIYFFFSQRVA